MKTKWSITVVLCLLVLCVLVVVQAALAQERERPARPARPAQADIGVGMYEGLDLTPEQQARMAEIRESMMEKMRNADSAEARRAIFTEMRNKMQAVLTEEQVAKMQERLSRPPGLDRPIGDQLRPSAEARLRNMDPLRIFDTVAPRLNLTQEQQAKITALREEAIRKLMQEIKTVLTDAQNEQLEQAQTRFRSAAAPQRQTPAGDTQVAPARREARRENAERQQPERTRQDGAAGERPQRTAGQRSRTQ